MAASDPTTFSQIVVNDGDFHPMGSQSSKKSQIQKKIQEIRKIQAIFGGEDSLTMNHRYF